MIGKHERRPSQYRSLILYDARIFKVIHSFPINLFICFADTSKRKFLTSFSCIFKLSVLVIMSKRTEASKKKYSNKGLKVEERKNRDIYSTSSANGGNAQSASSVGEFTAGKKYVTKMKVLKKQPIKTRVSDLEVDEYYVTFLESGGWSSELVWRMFQVFLFLPLYLGILFWICKGSIVTFNFCTIK